MDETTVGDKDRDLSGLRVLVVEDTVLIADLISMELADSGCQVVGPAAHLAEGLALASNQSLDGAFLDVNLAGESCVPIAQALDGRGIPYVFITGYDDLASLPAEYRQMPRMSKPFDPGQLSVFAARHFTRR